MKRVAIVEDNPDNRLLVEAILEEEFELELFEDGAAAVMGIPGFAPDVILLDISLPGMDGKEVLRRLRALPKTSAIPVVAFTAHAMYGDREDLLALGFDDYVSKPIVDEDVLLDAIRNLLTGAPCGRPVSDDFDKPDSGVTSDYTDPLIGRSFKDKYRIHSKLGEGGFGTVYRALQLAVDREVAVKVLRPDRAQDASQRDTLMKRFHREAVAMSKLGHPNTVQLIDFGTTDDGILFLVLELLQGIELSQAVATQAPLPPSRAAHIVRQICLSLAEAHAQGIIHRDLKPANVFLCHVAGENDHVKVMDFGIARVIEADASDGNLTKTGMTQGTPAYMSPEQAMALETTAASDLYSAGCMLYEMLTGEMPFTGESSVAISLAHVNDVVPTLRIPGASNALSARWNALFQRMMMKKQAQRVQSATEVAQLLESLAALPDPGDEDVAHIDPHDQTVAVAPAVAPTPEQDDLKTEMGSGALEFLQQEQTVVSQAPIELPNDTPRRVIGGIVAALAIVALGAIFLSETPQTPETPAAKAEASDEASPAAPTPASSAPRAAAIEPEVAAPTPVVPALIPATTPALAHVVLATQPAGALVYRTTQGEEALLCSTPCDVKVPASDEKETLTIRAPNYQDKHLEVRLSAHSQVALALNLDAKRRAKAKRKRRKGSASRPGQTGRGGAIPAALPRLRTHAPKDLPRLRTTTNP